MPTKNRHVCLIQVSLLKPSLQLAPVNELFILQIWNDTEVTQFFTNFSSYGWIFTHRSETNKQTIIG